MANKTNTTTNTDTDELIIAPASSLTKDLKTAVLVLSLIANLYIFTAWVALQVTTRYDDQLAAFLFNR